MFSILSYYGFVALLWYFCTLIFLFSFSSLATFLSSVHFLPFTAPLLLMLFLKFIPCKLGYVHIISVLCTLLFSVALCLCFGHMWEQVTWATKVLYTSHLITGLPCYLLVTMTFLGRNWPREFFSLETNDPIYLNITNVLLLEHLPLLLHNRIKGNTCHDIVIINRKVFFSFPFEHCLKQAYK